MYTFFKTKLSTVILQLRILTALLLRGAVRSFNLIAVLLITQLPITAHSEPSFKISNNHGRFSGTVVFTAIDKQAPTQKTKQQKSYIYLADLKAQTVSRYAKQSANTPTISPNGEKVAYSTEKGVIELSPLDKELPTITLATKLIAKNPAWSKDNSSIVFHGSETKNSGSNIFIAQPTNQQVDNHPYKIKRLTKFSGKNTTARLSPDGKRVAFSTNRFWPGWDICIWNISKKNESCVLGGNLSVFKPSWHPTENKIVFSAGSGQEFNLTKHNLTNGVRQELTTLPGREFDPSWSKDGAYIIFSAEITTKDNFDIYILEVESGEIFPLIESKLSLRDPSWHQRAQDPLDQKKRTKARGLNSELEAQDTYRPGYLDGTSN